MLQLTPSVWPLNDHLCSAFRILPCACASWRPVDQVLVPFARKEAEFVHALYVQQQAVHGESGEVAMLTEAPMARILADSLPERHSPERRLSLAGVGIRLDCAGCRIGDAYTHAFSTAPQSGVAQILLHGARVLGPKASVEDAFLLAASALKRRRTEGSSVSVVSDGVMAALERAASDEQTAVVCDVDNGVLMRRLVAALQLRSEACDKVSLCTPLAAGDKKKTIEAISRRALFEITHSDTGSTEDDPRDDIVSAIARSSARVTSREGLFVFEMRREAMDCYLMDGGKAVRVVPDSALSSARPLLVVVQHSRTGSKARVWHAAAE